MKRTLFSILLLLGASVLVKAQEQSPDHFAAKFGDQAYIVISKDSLTLKYIQRTEILKQYDISCSRYLGPKLKRGDNKTPEGEFKINQLLNSKGLKHDFGDGMGPVTGAYGPWFLRLDVPGFIDIGIHGTHLPESIGTRATEGCIRLRNEDIAELKGLVEVGTPVIILPDSEV